MLEACIDGTVRLRGSSVEYAGRVEICVETIWTSICNQRWDFNDAKVVCRELGYSSYGITKIYLCIPNVFDLYPRSCSYLQLLY